MNVYCLLSKSPNASTTSLADTSTADATAGFGVGERITCARSSEEPDVVVVVGGKEFKEYRQILRCWSGYFDAAFRSGMRESKSQRFEFPDRNPEEWTWIVSLLEPLSTSKITMDTLPVALDWFGMLCSTCGLEACDQFLCKNFLSKCLFSS